MGADRCPHGPHGWAWRSGSVSTLFWRVHLCWLVCGQTKGLHTSFCKDEQAQTAIKVPDSKPGFLPQHDRSRSLQQTDRPALSDTCMACGFQTMRLRGWIASASLPPLKTLCAASQADSKGPLRFPLRSSLDNHPALQRAINTGGGGEPLRCP